MSDNDKKPQTAAPQQGVRVRYDETTAQYAAQFLITMGEDDVVLNFSSGMMPDPRTGEAYLPVHTRIALSNSSARRLASLLTQALNAQGQRPANAAPAAAEAKLPSMDDAETKKSKK